MHYNGLLMTPIHKLVPFFESCIHERHLLHIFRQISSLLHFKKLLMHMGEFQIRNAIIFLGRSIFNDISGV